MLNNNENTMKQHLIYHNVKSLRVILNFSRMFWKCMILQTRFARLPTKQSFISLKVQDAL